MVARKYVGLLCLTLTSLAGVWAMVERGGENAWREHLQVDGVTYENRAATFSEKGTWSGLDENEYQPGALWFFLGVRWFGGDFRQSLVFVNSLLLLSHIVLIYWRIGLAAAWCMLALILGMGPILLYRFEALASLLVAGGVLLLRSKTGAGVGAGLVGMGVATKIYPLVLLPSILASFRREGRAQIVKMTACCAGGIGLLTAPFFLLGGSLQGVLSSIGYHLEKPIGVDSFWGSLLPLLFELDGGFLRMNSMNAIHGFALDGAGFAGVAKMSVSLLWIPLCLWVFLEALDRAGGRYAGAPGTLFTLLAIYVCFSKIFAPQYAWWALSLLPLVGGGWFSSREVVFLGIILLAYFAISQFIYPINYSEFIGSFSMGSHLESYLFWLNGLKNLLWVGVVWLSWRALLRALRQSEQQ